MEMKEIGSAQFRDAVSNENSYICVRVGHKIIGICLSKELDGDVEIFLRVEDCENLVSWLVNAIAEAGNA
jgi:hypothetical protein